MDEPVFQIRQCQRASCRFRYPIQTGISDSGRCPHCGAVTELMEPDFTTPAIPSGDILLRGPMIEVLLDNIRSTFNVGAMFRTADGAGLNHLHLCGMTPTPENPRIAKTSLGAEISVPWTHHPDALSAALDLKKAGFQLWALEGGPQSTSIFEVLPLLDGSTPLALVVGNEVSGVDPGILAQADQIITIPMQGTKRSLNVSIAFGVAIYFLRYADYLRSSPKTNQARA
jgi:23S rRNA (guanosine2251-2'-O)-methyltransferase